jgi:hypothetical protein
MGIDQNEYRALDPMTAGNATIAPDWPDWVAQGRGRPEPMQHRSYRGRIEYIYGDDAPIGREWFSVTVQPDGVRTLRAQCEMDDDQVLRDVVYTVGADWRPIDCFVRLMVHGKTMGHALFMFHDDRAETEGWNTIDQRLSTVTPLAHRPPVFGSHPVSVDGWQTAAYDHGNPDRIQQVRGGTNSSPLPNGASGPSLSIVDKAIEFVGAEELQVPAGVFKTNHYRILLKDKPPLEVWVEPEDRLFVRLSWTHLNSRYDLAELTR